MKIIDWLPEFPVSSEDDDTLMNYFINTSQIRQISEENKWMVLGRKGTGKTAIYKYYQSEGFSENNPNVVVVPLNFKSYPWPIHKLFKESMEGGFSAYYKSWEYVIIINSLTSLIRKYEQNRKLDADLVKAKKLLNNIYGTPLPSLIEIIKGKLFRLNTLSLPGLEVGDVNVTFGDLSLDDVSEDKKLLNTLKSNAFVLSAYFENLLIKYLNKNELIVTLDQLDEVWLDGEIEEYSKILISLINVCKEFNTSQKYMRHLKCIVFLRTDIYETLKFNDKNKIHQSSAIEIRWDENALNDLFFERIRKNVPSSLILDTQKKSNSIFEVRYVRHGATPFKHILRNSFYRPRDVIVFFNKIRQTYIDSKSGLYTSKNIYAAEKDFSISMYNELMDEWANQKPELEKYLCILQNIGTQKFSYADFSTSFASQFKEAESVQINECLMFLFQNSVIGQKINANWEYVCTNPYMQIDLSKSFHVNGGLKSRLTINEKRAKRKILDQIL